MWTTLWAYETLRLYEGVPKHIATAIFLLHTEVLGLNAWLLSVGVLGVSPHYIYNWPQQTVQHILTFCPNIAGLWDRFRHEAYTEDMDATLYTPWGAQAAARLLVNSELMAQFRVAKEVKSEDRRGYQPLPGLETWSEC
jgi:hypothetical protein